MKLRIKFQGGEFSLVENENAAFGLSFADAGGGGGRTALAQLLNAEFDLAVMQAGGCNQPSQPDIWNTALEAAKDIGAEILEFEGEDAPENAVF